LEIKMKKYLLLLSTLGVLTLSLTARAQDSTREEVAGAMDALRASRMAQARDVLKTSPYFSIAEGDTELLLLNRFGAPLTVAISVHAEQGGPWTTVGIVVVDPRATTPFSLASALGGTRLDFTSGSVAIRYQGDADMIQAWAVAHHGDEVAEVPLEVPGRSGGTTLWDLAAFPARSDPRAELLVTNTGQRADQVTVEVTNASGETITTQRQIPAYGRVALELSRQEGAGFATWRYEGGGSLVALAEVRSSETFSPLPIWASGGGELSFEAPNVRLFSERLDHELYPRDLTLLVLNRAKEPRQALVELLSLDGTVVYSETLVLPHHVLRRVDTVPLLRTAQSSGSKFLRLRLTVDGTGVLPHGLVSDQGHNPVELAFFSNLDAHASGGYPIPDTNRYDVATTIVNVGAEASHVVGQLAWSSGEWTVGPFVIDPGAAHRLAFDDLLAAKRADLLGRVPESALRDAVFQWTVQAGGRELIARTEARERYSNDRFGFNCFGCCPEMTWGELIPGAATFPAGGSAALEASQFISSCSFTVGPIRSIGPTLTYTAPLSWNGITVSSQAPTQQVVRFTEEVQVQGLQCLPRTRTISDFGQIEVEGPEVRILSVSLPNNQIRIQLVGNQSLSGVLNVELRGGTGVSRQIASAGRGAGTYTFGFGDLNSYPNGARYTQVFAQWNVNGMTPSDSFSYGIKVLGNYLHTRYNTVSNASCPGSNTRKLCYTNGTSCTGVSCSSWSSVQAKPLFMSELAENGSAFHSSIGFVSIEWFCANPSIPGCSPVNEERGRRVPSACPTCPNLDLTANQTVAISPENNDLACGDQVYVVGTGLRRVTDNGGRLGRKQLDHYSGVSGCNQTAGTIGNRKTFKIF